MVTIWPKLEIPSWRDSVSSVTGTSMMGSSSRSRRFVRSSVRVHASPRFSEMKSRFPP